METVCGIDEAGRGPLAGPVTAGAVVLPEDFPLELLADSKSLSAKKRNIALQEILELAFFGVGWAWPEEIDHINIHQASLLAMTRAWFDLSRDVRAQVSLVQVDGKFPPRLEVAPQEAAPPKKASRGSSVENLMGNAAPGPDSVPAGCKIAQAPVEAVIKGDTIHPHIQAASILAKEARDRWMIRYSWIEPAWEFGRHKGYPTALHRKLCLQEGLSEIHRRSFRIFSE